jgi:ankyrin repeat protein
MKRKNSIDIEANRELNKLVQSSPQDMIDKMFNTISSYNLDLNGIRELIDQGVDINIQEGEDGDTALICTIRHSNFRIEIAKLLIELRADVNKENDEGNSALDFAILKLDPELVKVLLEADATFDPDIIITTLIDVADYCLLKTKDDTENLKAIISLLLDYNASINFPISENEPTLLRNSDEDACFRPLREAGHTPLIFTIHNRMPELACLLITRGADVNDDNGADSALTLTLDLGMSEVAELLIRQGADFEPRLFRMASDSGYSGAVKEFIIRGADVNVRYNCLTALEFAAINGQSSIVNILLESNNLNRDSIYIALWQVVNQENYYHQEVINLLIINLLTHTNAEPVTHEHVMIANHTTEENYDDIPHLFGHQHYYSDAT